MQIYKKGIDNNKIYYTLEYKNFILTNRDKPALYIKQILSNMYLVYNFKYNSISIAIKNYHNLIL